MLGISYEVLMTRTEYYEPRMADNGQLRSLVRVITVLPRMSV